MAAIIKYYLDVFVPSYESSSDRMIDISKLIEYRENWSPVELPYANKEESIRILGAAIIINFCNSYRQTKMFPKRGVEMLTKIIRKTIDSPDVVAQAIFLVHITKRNIDIDLFAYLILKTDTMKVKTVLLHDEREWVQLANKVVHHKQINDIIDECIVDFGQVPQRSTSVDEQEEIKITLVENSTTFLRGFVGFQEIFIHADHLQEKIDAFKEDVDLLQLICKMDIICVVLHELSHLKIRKCIGNFNMRTPVLAALKGLPVNNHEFGTYTELRIFKKQIDWFRSGQTVDIGYMEKFINAIENQTQLPPGFIEGALPRSGIPDMEIPIMDGSPDGNIGGNDGSKEDSGAVAKPAVPHILIVLATIFLIKNF